MRSNLPRHLVPATLAVAILIAPLPALATPSSEAPAPSFGATFESVVAWAGDILRHLWAEEGGSFDPLGRPEPVPAADQEGGRQ